LWVIERFTKRLRRRRPRPGDTWHDEVFLRIGGVLHYLWRAVDQHGVVLDILVQEKRDGAAAKRFFRRLLKGLRYKPKRLITDGLRSYGVSDRCSGSSHPARRRTSCRRTPSFTDTFGHGGISSALVIIGVRGRRPFRLGDRRRLSSRWDNVRHVDLASANSFRCRLIWQFRSALSPGARRTSPR
jgi:hypothetical protein